MGKKLYGRDLNERMKVSIQCGDEQGGLRKGKGWKSQIFELKTIFEKYLEKCRKLFAIFMDMEFYFFFFNVMVAGFTVKGWLVGPSLLESQDRRMCHGPFSFP